MRTTWWVAWLLLAVPILIGAEPAKTVILVRHAERAGGMAPEVGLNKAGRCRAQVLAGMLADAGVTHIFSSDVARAQQTAEPLAKKLGLKMDVVAGKDYDTLIGKLRTAGGVSLVVGTRIRCRRSSAGWVRALSPRSRKAITTACLSLRLRRRGRLPWSLCTSGAAGDRQQQPDRTGKVGEPQRDQERLGDERAFEGGEAVKCTVKTH